ncbi:MAG: histidine kinase dimerization/phosphoacceptor domain -containing protein [Erythrobacter sp.]
MTETREASAGEGAQAAGRLIDQQRMLSDFGIYALNADNLDEVLNRACKLVTSGLGENLAKIVEQIEGEEKLYVRAFDGYDLQESERWIKSGSGSSAGHALVTGTPTISTDAKNDPRFERAELEAEEQVRSVVNVPIQDVLGGENVWFGVLEVDSERVDAFAEDEIDFLRLYANLIAAAIGRQKALDVVEKALGEKEHLLRELQHRIKNNLATVTGLINLQSRKAKEEETVKQLEAINRRVETLRLVHEKLYSRNSTERIQLRPYLRELIENLVAFHNTGSTHIVVDTNFEDVLVEADAAIPIGLIINEFITNSIKYAFTDGSGRIGADLIVDRGEATLTLCDDGIGLPAPDERTEGTGMTIINGLAKQLGGSAQWSNSDGAVLEIGFRMN